MEKPELTVNRRQTKDKSKKNRLSSWLGQWCRTCHKYESFNLHLEPEFEQNTKVLALDLGAKMGAAIGQSDGTLIECFELNLSKLVFNKRFKVYRTCICEIINRLQPEMIFYEKVYGHIGRVAAHHYGYYEGTLQVCAATIPVIGIAPTQVKKIITGSGNAEKDEVRQAVNKLYNIDIPHKYTNASDAVAVFAASTRKAKT